jgi:hypothetical protein
VIYRITYFHKLLVASAPGSSQRFKKLSNVCVITTTSLASICIAGAAEAKRVEISSICKNKMRNRIMIYMDKLLAMAVFHRNILSSHTIKQDAPFGPLLPFAPPNHSIAGSKQPAPRSLGFL